MLGEHLVSQLLAWAGALHRPLLLGPRAEWHSPGELFGLGLIGAEQVWQEDRSQVVQVGSDGAVVAAFTGSLQAAYDIVEFVGPGCVGGQKRVAHGVLLLPVAPAKNSTRKNPFNL
jgi:hypothetical protein